MYRIIIFSLLLYLAACQQSAELSSSEVESIPEELDFNFHVKPILSDRCFACHGPDQNHQEADLRLDTPEGAFAALAESEGHAIVPGDLAKSVAYQRVISDDPDDVMPPPESNLVLTEYEKEILKKWIEEGAEYKPHWSFTPPERAESPKVKDSDWANNAIDQFVLARLEQEGLKPAPEANKEKLLRRVTFDLTGLPPTLEEIADFMQDDSPQAYERVVDRLLASPHYGERMAPTWLDASRYADSHGYQDDRPRTMWPWRDWVVDAFNQNLPYDQFVTWQLAGDLLPNATYEQKLATGFNRNHAITQEGGVIEEEYLTEYAADRANTFSTAFLGLTVECARCHDHKYDPISQKEYYQLFAFFNNVPERGQINYLEQSPEPTMRVQNAELEAKKAFVDSTILVLEERLQQIEKKPDDSFNQWLADNSVEEAIDTEADLVTHFELDMLENEEFLSSDGTLPARMNVALPKNIKLPEHVSAKKEKGLQFDGSNFLTLGDIGDFDHYDHFSFGGWIRHTNQHEKRAGLFSRRNGEIQRQGYDLTLTKDNRLSLRLIHHEGQKYVEVTTKARINPQQWAHVFATYDGSGKAAGVQLYINGKAQPLTVQHDNLGRNPILNGNTFLVGHWNHRARSTDTYGFAGGTIDEVRLYQRTLSPLEVQALAETSLNTSEENLYRHYLVNVNQDFRTISEKLADLRATDVSIPNVMVMQEREERKPAFILARGAYDAPTDPVDPGTPEALLAFGKQFPQNRLGLAQWLIHEDNPLTARVAVNRFWQMYFGNGLVRTPEDFGNQGALPTHPELLDWLAVEFRESGWDVKALQKLIVMSATYCQSAEIDSKKYQRDSENLLLARGPNVRLTAEMFRDNALAVSGLLVDSIGGKWVKPYQPAGIWKAMANQIGENKYRPSKGEGLYRRSLYTYWKRTIPPPTMVMFDAPERTLCAVKRQSTSTPLQSLALLNDPQLVEAARKLAEKMLTERQEKPEDQIAYGFQAVTSRTPAEDESKILLSLYKEKQAYYQERIQEAESLLKVGEASRDKQLNTVDLAAMTIVANTLFNLDEAKFRS
ncbi:DUF1553 domain-containing protein [Tunicatimonas pelagia]|uniref:DUF1553 domain-containing protein n=1 Tax=Tunicatimonas pelagia TaxID=931531 RepID=UPI002666598A|nr:DUF1553 domain-containing protein [Tunicatimonas pelagia]WKN45611.1 DUF1553 domain-containing protein [Tunicatimonas pelagia]